jgi:hypothetical protein
MVLIILLGGCSVDRLSDTGLYADIATGTLAEGVRPFRPQWELWSDGATKRRFLSLPPGTRIDTSNMDGWIFPVGTRVWKEFSRDGVRVETRLLRKDGPGRQEWTLTGYVWNDDQSDAVAAPDGQENALGTAHDVPDSKTCKACHEGAIDALIGVSAIQLDHELGDLSLATLSAENLITVSPPGRYAVPGNDVEREALGYLHANCGHCHNDHASGPAGVLFQLALTVRTLGSVVETPAYRTSVGAPSRVPMPLPGTSAMQIVAPGDPEASLLYIRMKRRSPEKGQMPSVASELVDIAGAAAVAAWIRALPH